jgi:hypothetical protein
VSIRFAHRSGIPLTFTTLYGFFAPRFLGPSALQYRNKEQLREKDLSTAQYQAQKDPRLPQKDEKRQGRKGPFQEARQGPQAHRRHHL